MIQQIRRPGGLDQRHNGRIMHPVQHIHQHPAVDAASALAWLVTAGADAIVTETPRNWLAEPPPAPVAVPRPVIPSRAAAPAAPIAAQVKAEALAATDLAALDAAIATFAHPLRRADTAPRLLTGNSASGIIVLGDVPEGGDTPLSRLTARMLAAIGLTPENSAFGHLLPWELPAGRPPRPEEIAAFAPFRTRAFELAAPKLVLAFGERAAALSGASRGIASIRGQWLAIGNVPALATFHPRILLNQPELKRLAWADLQAFAARIETLT
jgi:uracil-DNA glycosylase family 4